MPLLPTVVDFDITSYTSLPGWGSLGGEPYERVSHCSSEGTDESGVNGSRGTWRRNIRRVGPFPLLAEATAVAEGSGRRRRRGPERDYRGRRGQQRKRADPNLQR